MQTQLTQKVACSIKTSFFLTKETRITGFPKPSLPSILNLNKYTMKKSIPFCIALIFTTTLVFSQDIIKKTNGDEIRSKVVDVTATDVKYKKFEDLKGPTFSIRQSELSEIRYENGTTDTFLTDTPVITSESTNQSTLSESELFLKGQADASVNYKKYKGAGTGTLIVSLISPLVGLIPAIACSATTPQDQNLGFPSEQLMQKPSYAEGYTKKAKGIKRGKVWTNWGIAFGANLVAVLIISSK